MKLTQAAVKSLEPQAKRYYAYDAKDRWFGVTVHPSGKKTYIVRTTIHGKTKRITLKSSADLTADDARKAGKEIVRQIASGQDPAEEKRKARVQGMTLTAALDIYLANKRTKNRPLKESTQADYRKRINYVFKAYLERPLASITDRDIERLVAASTGQASTAAALRYFSAVWNYTATRPGTKDAFQDLTNPTAWMAGERYIAPRRQTYIARKDLPAWWKAAHDLKPRHRDLQIFLLLTGIRIGSSSESGGAQHLHWRDITADTFNLYDTKNGTDLELPLPAYCSELLEQRRGHPDTPVFSRCGDGRYGYEAIEKATGDRYTPHDLRRTYATAAAAVMGDTLLKRLMGHATTGDVTQGYVMAEANDLAAASRRAVALLLEAANGQA